MGMWQEERGPEYLQSHLELKVQEGKSQGELQKLLDRTVTIWIKLVHREAQTISEVLWRNSRGLIHH